MNSQCHFGALTVGARVGEVLQSTDFSWPTSDWIMWGSSIRIPQNWKPSMTMHPSRVVLATESSARGGGPCESDQMRPPRIIVPSNEYFPGCL